MKTNTETAAWVARRRAAHHSALTTLAADPAKADGLTLWRGLRWIKKHAERIILDYSNGTGGVTTDNIQEKLDPIREAVRKVFGQTPKGFFVNTDPRGYALKIDPDKGTVPEGMATDWGRYGLLAAEIDEN